MARLEDLGSFARIALDLPLEHARLRWTPARLAALRTRRLRRLLRLAAERSPWHRARLRGLDPATATEADLQRLPPMTKDEVMANWDAAVTHPALTLARARAQVERDPTGWLEGRWRVFVTGGTSGRTGVFVHDRRSWEATLTSYARMVLHARRRAGLAWPGGVVVSIGAESEVHVSAAVARAFHTPLARTHHLSVTRPLGDLVSRLVELQPTMLASYGSMLAELVIEAEAGRLDVAPALVLSTGDPLLPATRAAVERLWGARVLNVWATTEVGATAIGCGEGEGMHLVDDHVIYEPVDRDLRPVPPGEPAAMVLVTSLVNDAQPLVRYVLDDEIRLLTTPCPCGCTHARVADVQGRADDVLAWGRVRVHPHTFRAALVHVPGLRGFQVRQLPSGVEVDVVLDRPHDLEALRRDLARRLADHGLADPVAHVRRVPELPRVGPGAKVRRFVRAQG